MDSKLHIVLLLADPKGNENKFVNIKEMKNIESNKVNYDKQIVLNNKDPGRILILKKWDIISKPPEMDASFRLFHFGNDEESNAMVDYLKLSKFDNSFWKQLIPSKYNIIILIKDQTNKTIDKINIGCINDLPVKPLERGSIYKISKSSSSWWSTNDTLLIPENKYGIIGFEKCQSDVDGLFRIGRIFIDQSKKNLYEVFNESF